MPVLSIRATHVPRTGVARMALSYTWAHLGVMLRARATRRLLMEMDDRMLADIGIDRGTALTEASRAMWDVAPRRR